MKLHDVTQGSDEWLALRRRYFTASNLGEWLVEEPEFRWTKDQIGVHLGMEKKDITKATRDALVEMIPAEVVEMFKTYTATRDKAWKIAIWNKLGELSADDEPEKETWAMRRGKELEPLARDAYAKAFGYQVAEVGFISHDSEGFGCSPDGLITETALTEFSINLTSGESSSRPVSARPLWGLEIKCPVARTMLQWLDAGTLPDEHKLQVHASMAVTGLPRWDFWAWHPELKPLHIVVERDEFTERVLMGLLNLSDDYMAAKGKLQGWLTTRAA